MLEHATLESFTPHLGQPFDVVQPSGERVPIVLTEATLAPTDNDPRRTRVPFSLIFRPNGSIAMQQGMYRIEREGFGAVELFLVQIMPDRDGPRIQAVFA